MSWLYSRALVAEYLGGNSLDGEQCALWNGTPTQQASWLPAKTTDACRLSRSGMTFRPLTETHGEDVLMSFLAAFPAKTSPPQERAPESKASEAVCGSTWRESSVKYCPLKSGWKTHRCLWEEDLEPSSLTLPKWGMTRSGVLWERITPPPLTSGTESGSSESWATPTTMDKLPPKSAEALHKEATQARPGRSKPANLRDQVSNSHMWPTPKAHEPGMTAKTTGRGVEKSTHLTTQVALAEGMIDRNTGRLWPTPQAHKITRSGEIVNADGTEWDGLSKPHSKTTGRPITTALADAVAMWPTPAARDCKGANSREHCETNGTGRKHMDQLPNAVAHPDLRFATPQARDFRTGQQSRWENPERTRNLNDQIGGQLNPTWVEWLMGWPLGWTDCAASATDKFQQWLSSHGKH